MKTKLFLIFLFFSLFLLLSGCVETNYGFIPANNNNNNNPNTSYIGNPQSQWDPNEIRSAISQSDYKTNLDEDIQRPTAKTPEPTESELSENEINEMNIEINWPSSGAIEVEDF